MNFDDILQAGHSAMKKTSATADVVAQKGKEMAKLILLEKKLETAQQKLGILVYSMSKNNSIDSRIVTKHIETIDSLETQIEKIKKG